MIIIWWLTGWWGWLFDNWQVGDNDDLKYMLYMSQSYSHHKPVKGIFPSVRKRKMSTVGLSLGVCHFYIPQNWREVFLFFFFYFEVKSSFRSGDLFTFIPLTYIIYCLLVMIAPFSFPVFSVLEFIDSIFLSFLVYFPSFQTLIISSVL